MKIIAVNAGPRTGWNTDTLIPEAIKGAESAGAVVERIDLFKLERHNNVFPEECRKVFALGASLGASLVK